MLTTDTYTEQALIDGCRRNEPKVQQALYKRYYRKMYGVCLRYAENKDDAADILQDSFIQVFRYIIDFRGGSLEGWIRRIVVNMSIAYYRKKTKYVMTDIEDAKHLSWNESILESMNAEEILKLIHQLPIGYRTIFNLYEIEGYNHNEIAEMMHISVGTSKSQLSRAKEILRNQIQQKLGTY
jgi:RNA polymerase sigma-70 factor (ECF subfamily)